MTKRRIVLLGISSVGSGIALAGCSGGNPESENEDISNDGGSETEQGESDNSDGQAIFEITDTTDGTEYSVEDETVVGGTVVNTGSSEGSQTVELRSRGESLSEVEIQLEPDESYPAKFTYDSNSLEEGEYEFTLVTEDDQESMIITVIDNSPDVRIEYETTVGKEPEQLSSDFRDVWNPPDNSEGKREEGYKWVVIEITVLEGELDMEDIWFRSRVETEERFYELDHASDELTDGIQSRGSIKQGGNGIALYQIPEDSEFVRWNLEETNQNIKNINNN
jgi:hypothetical protein